MTQSKLKIPTIEEIIYKAVAAQRLARDRQTRDIFKETEKRLYAYPILKKKIESERQFIEQIRRYGVPDRSKSIVLFQRGGDKLTAEERTDLLVNEYNLRIAESEHELETIDNAMTIIADDPYADIVKYKYFDGKSDDEIALLIHCAPRTVRRNKSRLVGRLAVFLYGVTAVK